MACVTVYAQTSPGRPASSDVAKAPPVSTVWTLTCQRGRGHSTLWNTTSFWKKATFKLFRLAARDGPHAGATQLDVPLLHACIFLLSPLRSVKSVRVVKSHTYHCGMDTVHEIPPRECSCKPMNTTSRIDHMFCFFLPRQRM